MTDKSVVELVEDVALHQKLQAEVWHAEYDPDQEITTTARDIMEMHLQTMFWIYTALQGKPLPQELYEQIDKCQARLMGDSND